MTEIVTSTKSLKKGDILFCDRKAERYIDDNILQIASQVIVEKGFKERSLYRDSKILEIKNPRRELVSMLHDRYELPNELIAITGTSGKTSSCWFTFQLLNLSGTKTGYIGGIGIYIWDKKQNKPKKVGDLPDGMTTPPIDEMYRLLNSLKMLGCETVVFEASSIALDKQKRLDGIKVDIAAFTNFSQEHLDYHETMEAYFDAKMNLFRENLKPDGVAILNSDDGKFEEARQHTGKFKTVTFGSKEPYDLQIVSTKQTLKGLDIVLKIERKEFEVKLMAFGEFQAQNLAIALMVGIQKGLQAFHLCEKIQMLAPPVGRMEQVIDLDGKLLNVFVDYAHKPDALKHAILSLRQMGKVLCVFGCGGNRDKLKRPLMGKIAATFADKVIITSDNPRNEDPLTIIDEIKSGIPKELLNKVSFYPERTEAIGIAMQSLKEYIILIAGKGHEEYQIIGNEEKHFVDKEEVLKWR